MVPRESTIGNTGNRSEEIARTGAVSATSNHPTRPPIGLPGANTEPGTREHLLEMARLWHLGGCSVAPAKPDGSKVPKAQPGAGLAAEDGKFSWGWKRLSTGDLPRLELDTVTRQLRAAADGIGVFCGPPSGELEMLELEGRVVDRLPLLAARARERGIEHLWQRLEAGCSDWSPSGGLHWYHRTTDGPALGNTKLALRVGADGKLETLAETRGRGGWSVVAGSFGRTHGSGKPYVMRSGSPLTIPGFTCAERDAIHALFRTLDEVPEVTSPPPKEIAKRERPEGEILPGDDFDARGRWEDVFPAGWARLSQSAHADAWSMHGAGGRKTGDVYHESSTFYAYDTDCPGAGRKLTKFAALAWLRHGGDFAAAAAELYRQGYGTRRELLSVDTKKKSPAVRVEPAQETSSELVAIEQYRRDIVQALADVVLDGKPGFKLLRGDPGTGKTYAVSRTVARYSGGITSVPSHELAAEVVEQLRAAGADAAAYPRLDETTCANFETASRAQAAGLSAPATVCGSCPLIDQCRESGYLALVKQAQRATHKVVTHARLARSAARLLEKASYVVLEEDPSAVLAPMVSATRRQLERVGDLAATFADAEARVSILEGTDLVRAVEPIADFEAWAPPAQAGDEFRNNVPELGSGNPPAYPIAPAPEPVDNRRRKYPRGFFGQLCRVADELSAAAAGALVDELPDGMHEIRVEPTRDLPKNPEGVVWAALNTMERVDPDSVVGISAETMQLALAVASGRAERVFVQVETDARPGGRRSAEIVAVWRTELGWLDRVVFVNDGTLELDALKRLVVHSQEARDQVAGLFEDITPAGRVPLLHQAIQYPVDILPTTSSAKVAAILAGIVRAHPDKPRVGVLLHQKHYRALLEAEDSPLPADVRERIVWGTYFQSGADRGTNALHQLADMAIILGTHRPPPSEIRRTLARWGELEAANSSATWGRIDRQGLGHDGGKIPYHGRGYAELAWAAAADAIIRATVRQAVGRARAIDPRGVAVVAVTTEAVGLPINDPAALPIAPQRVDEILFAIAGAGSEVVKIGNLETDEAGENRAIFPNNNLRVFGAILDSPPVPLEDVEKRLPGVPRRTVLRWMADAIDAGLVLRLGAARATRYALAPPATAVVSISTAPMIEAPKPEPVVVRLDPPAPQAPAARAPMSMARIEIPKPAAVVPVPPPPPPPRPTPPPPVVAEQPAEEWLERVLSPERYPSERFELECYLSGPHATRIGFPIAWAEETKPLVLKLHRVATAEARRQGQPPPPVDLVARHTVAWYAATLSAVAG